MMGEAAKEAKAQGPSPCEGLELEIQKKNTNELTYFIFNSDK